MTSVEGVVALDSGYTLEFGTVELRDQTQAACPTSIYSRQSAEVAGIKWRALRELSHSTNRFGEISYFCRILRILVSDRVDLSVGGSGVKMCLQKVLDFGIGA